MPTGADVRVPGKGGVDVLGQQQDPRNHWACGVNDGNGAGNESARIGFRLEQGSSSDGSFDYRGRRARDAISAGRDGYGVRLVERPNLPQALPRLHHQPARPLLPRAHGTGFPRPLKRRWHRPTAERHRAHHRHSHWKYWRWPGHISCSEIRCRFGEECDEANEAGRVRAGKARYPASRHKISITGIPQLGFQRGERSG